MKQVNELKLATYKSAMEKGMGRRDDKGNEIALNALKSMAEAIGRELKGKSFIVKPSNPKEFNSMYGYNHHGNNLSRPFSGQYKMTFDGSASALNPNIKTFDPADYSIIMGVSYTPASEDGGGWSSNSLRVTGYDTYTKDKCNVQFSIRNGGVDLFDRRLSSNGSLQLSRKDARMMAEIAKELLDAIGGDSSAVNHNAIKQFTPLQESQNALKYVKLFESHVNEKSDFIVYHDSYGSAIDAVEDFANRYGYELDQEEYGNAYVDAFFKPKKGDTKKDTLTLYKNGKEQRRALHVQIYRRSNDKYELNMYIN